MRSVPHWAFGVGILGLCAVVAGVYFPGTYLQDVLLQVGTVAFLLVPILLAERSIGQRLARQADDYAAIQRSESGLAQDEILRDYGQKLGSKWNHQPRIEIEARLGAEGWVPGRSVDGYRIWSKESERVALPHAALTPAAIVRLVTRITGWPDDTFATPWNQTDEPPETAGTD